MDYKPRIADDLLALKLESFGATLIVGPKGCGKTTTAKQQARSVIELQDEDLRDQYLEVARIKPSNLLIGDKPRLIDEWQDAPKIWGAVRKSVDDEGENGLYILTGSTSKKVKKPHTGTLRISKMTMYPMSLFESGESNGTVSLRGLFEGKFPDGAESGLDLDGLTFAICRGGWPQCFRNKTQRSKLEVAKDLFRQTCDTDISAIDNVKRDPLLARRILRSYSRNLCTLAKMSTVYTDADPEGTVSRKTLDDYVDALRRLYIVEDIGAWNTAIRSKTSMRSGKKRNMVDPSIAVAAMGLAPEYFLTDFRTLGFLFECLCIRDLKVYSSRMGGEVSYYHDRFDLEADCVLHLEDGRYALIEFKLGADGIEDGARNLNRIDELVRESGKEGQNPMSPPTLKMVVTGTQFAYRREDGVYVVPIGCLRDRRTCSEPCY